MRSLMAVLAIAGCGTSTAPDLELELDRSASIDLVTQISRLTGAMKASDGPACRRRSVRRRGLTR